MLSLLRGPAPPAVSEKFTVRSLKTEHQERKFNSFRGLQL